MMTWNQNKHSLKKHGAIQSRPALLPWCRPCPDFGTFRGEAAAAGSHPERDMNGSQLNELPDDSEQLRPYVVSLRRAAEEADDRSSVGSFSDCFLIRFLRARDFDLQLSLKVKHLYVTNRWKENSTSTRLLHFCIFYFFEYHYFTWLFFCVLCYVFLIIYTFHYLSKSNILYYYITFPGSL